MIFLISTGGLEEIGLQGQVDMNAQFQQGMRDDV